MARNRISATRIAPDAPAPKLGRPLKRSFFGRSVHEVAPDLIGATLLVNGVGGIIVEVEAYHHSRAGRAFVQRTDAAQHGDVRAARFLLCLSLLRHPLVRQFRLRKARLRQRGADPRAGADPRPRHDASAPRRRGRARRCVRDRANCAKRSGSPSKHSELPLDQPPFALHARIGKADIVTGVRIGITKAADLPWRYGLKGSKFLSKPFERSTVA